MLQVPGQGRWYGRYNGTYPHGMLTLFTPDFPQAELLLVHVCKPCVQHYTARLHHCTTHERCIVLTAVLCCTHCQVTLLLLPLRTGVHQCTTHECVVLTAVLCCTRCQVTLLLLPLWTGGQRAVLSSTQLVVVCWAVLSTVQLVMLKRNVQLYCRYRHNIVVAIRLLRLASFLVPALNRNFDVMGKWAKPQQHTAGYTLAAYALFSAMCQLQVSSCIYHASKEFIITITF